MDQNEQRTRLSSMINDRKKFSNELMLIIFEVTKELYLFYPIEDSQLLINEDNQVLNGIWQQVLFESNLKYGDAYLEGLNEIEAAELSSQDIKNQQIIQQNDPKNWYYFENDQLRLAKADDVIDAIDQVDIDVAIENATNWDEVDCTKAMQYALGFELY